MDRLRAGTRLDRTDTVALLERYQGQMLSTARRYSRSAHDAEDAYQRASEILLTHHPSGSDDDLCRWLRTTVKHEALAIRRHGDRCVPLGGPDALPPGSPNPADTEVVAERYERLSHTARALATLKPHERRCLLLRVEGFSYQEICAFTEWTYTKVNRCLSEGRRSVRQQLAAADAA